MKRSLIWTTAGAAVIGFGVPAYAAVQTSKPQPRITTVVAPATQPSVSVDDNGTDVTVDSVDDNGTDVTVNSTVSSIDDTTQNSIDDNGVDNTTNSIDDNGTDITVNSIDDSTDNTIDDISGPCDEAEHAADPRCTGVAAPGTSVDDNPSADDSTDDNGHHGGGDDSGHGGSDD